MAALVVDYACGMHSAGFAGKFAPRAAFLMIAGRPSWFRLATWSRLWHRATDHGGKHAFPPGSSLRTRSLPFFVMQRQVPGVCLSRKVWKFHSCSSRTGGEMPVDRAWRCSSWTMLSSSAGVQTCRKLWFSTVEFLTRWWTSLCSSSDVGFANSEGPQFIVPAEDIPVVQQICLWQLWRRRSMAVWLGVVGAFSSVLTPLFALLLVFQELSAMPISTVFVDIHIRLTLVRV